MKAIEGHVLHRLLPQPKDTGYKLRQRAHNLTLHSTAFVLVICNTSARDICALKNYLLTLIYDETRTGDATSVRRVGKEAEFWTGSTHAVVSCVLTTDIIASEG